MCQRPLTFLQGRTVKGTTASSPASVILAPGDKLLSINGVSVESWGRLRVQDVRHIQFPCRTPQSSYDIVLTLQALSRLVEDLGPENPKRAVFFRTKMPTGGRYNIVTGTLQVLFRIRAYRFLVI